MPKIDADQDVAMKSRSVETAGGVGMSGTTQTASGYGWRVGLFYGALFLIYGVQIPFMPIWLDWRGLSAIEIAFVGAAPFFLRVVVSPLLAMVADRKGSHRAMILVLAAVAVVTSVGLSQIYSHDFVVLASIVLAIAMISMMPLTETIAVQGVQRAGLDYGRMRLWGSATFILIGFLAGALVTQFKPGIIIWLTASACLATLVLAFVLPRARLNTDVGDKPTVSLKSEDYGLQARDAARLLKHPLFLMFLVAGGTIQAAHATFYTFGALLWTAQGITATWIGGLWAIGVVSEILVFAYAGRVMGGNRAMWLLIAGGIAAVLRWVVMSFTPALWVLVPLQVLHGLTYGAAHLGAIYFMSAAVPDKVMGTAQALYGSAAAGVAMGLAMLAAGHLYEVYAGASYLAMAGLGMVGLIASLVIWRQWSGGLLWEDA